MTGGLSQLVMQPFVSACLGCERKDLAGVGEGRGLDTDLLLHSIEHTGRWSGDSRGIKNGAHCRCLEDG